MAPRTRRHVLRFAAGALPLALAGCGEPGGDGGEEEGGEAAGGEEEEGGEAGEETGGEGGGGEDGEDDGGAYDVDEARNDVAPPRA